MYQQFVLSLDNGKSPKKLSIDFLREQSVDVMFVLETLDNGQTLHR